MAIDETGLFAVVQLEMSSTFSRRLEQDLVAAMQPEVNEENEEVTVKVVEREVGHRGDDSPLVRADEPVSPGRRRRNVVLAAAASIAIVAALTAVIVDHKSPSTTVDTTHDPEIAKAAIISPSALGAQWEVSHLWGDLTSRSLAESAATVPECEPYLDDAFDTAGRQAVTAGRHFGIPGADLITWIVTQWVYIYPSEKAASEAMDRIAESGFLPCFDNVFRRMYGSGQATRLDALPVTPHGDRQIVIGQHLAFGTPTPGGDPNDGQITVDVMNVWVQIGRAVVFVDPSPDFFHDSLDPGSRIELAVSAATKALEAALDKIYS